MHQRKRKHEQTQIEILKRQDSECVGFIKANKGNARREQPQKEQPIEKQQARYTCLIIQPEYAFLSRSAFVLLLVLLFLFTVVLPQATDGGGHRRAMNTRGILRKPPFDLNFPRSCTLALVLLCVRCGSARARWTLPVARRMRAPPHRRYGSLRRSEDPFESRPGTWGRSDHCS